MKWLALTLALLISPGLYSQNAEEMCLAKAIYYESRGQPIEGQKAVAQVVINRSEHPAFPNSMCGVIYQKAQFSFIGTKLSAPRGDQWALAKDIANTAISDGYAIPDFKALYFHATHVSPKWKRKRLAKIGSHIFYS